MDTYSLLREFADSWVLLAMFAFFIGAAIWAFLPSQSKARDEASMIPLRDDPVATEATTPAAAPKGSDDG
jgi:cytochrome c oxidase cbb3-type subunit 4